MPNPFWNASQWSNIKKIDKKIHCSTFTAQFVFFQSNWLHMFLLLAFVWEDWLNGQVGSKCLDRYTDGQGDRLAYVVQT
jgi:hypothetical protein